jgi:peptidoglycan hydrolase-like protein with peptidoglycan-binding domain
VDISGTGGFGGLVYKRLAGMAPAYGWTNDEGRAINESWHWTYTGRGGQQHDGRRKPQRIGTVSRSRRHLPGTKRRQELWQRFLNTQGPDLHVDGNFGPKTEDATKVYQRSRGLDADGVVGYRTWYSAILGTRAGKRGVSVEIAQRVLGLTGKDIDGVAGPVFDTRARELQRWLEVAPDGVLGPRSVEALIRNG